MVLTIWLLPFDSNNKILTSINKILISKFASIKIYADDLTIYAKINSKGDKKQLQL